MTSPHGANACPQAPMIPESLKSIRKHPIVSVLFTADDYPVFLAGMRQSLAPCSDIVVVAECTRFSDLLAEVASNKPEVILLGCDSNLENLSQQLHSIAELHSDVKGDRLYRKRKLNFHEVALRTGQRVFC